MLGFIEKLDGRTNLTRHLYNMAGTGAQWDSPFDPTNVVATQVESRYWERQGVWYPAQAVPMNGSVDIGVAEAVRLIKLRDPREEHVWIVYSQSAIVWYYIYQMMLPGGELEDYNESWVNTITYGNPCAEKNVAYGNELAGLEIPDGTGIAPFNFVNTDRRQLDFRHKGDMYTDCPEGETGEMIRAIFNLVFSKFVGKDTVLEQVWELLTDPFRESLALFDALYHAIVFYGSGTRPHVDYELVPAVQHLNFIGQNKPIVLH